MKRKQIEEAAARYSGSALGFKNNLAVIDNHKAFAAGARWRINSVWHYTSEKPDKGKLLIVEDIDSAYDLVYLTKSNPWKELSEKNHYMRWAYVEDLLPNEKGGEE